MPNKKDVLYEFFKLIGLVMAGGLISLYVNQRYGTLSLEEILTFANIGNLALKTVQIIITIALAFLLAYLGFNLLINVGTVLGNVITEPLSLILTFFIKKFYKKYPCIITHKLKEHLEDQKKEYAQERKKARFLSKHYYPSKEKYNLIACMSIFVISLIFIQRLYSLLKIIGITFYLLINIAYIIFWAIKLKNKGKIF